MRTADDLLARTVLTPTGCRVLLNCLDTHGYVNVRVGTERRKRLGHRFIYREKVGEIPEGMSVLHKCDVPNCLEPTHLFVGSQVDNMADMKAKGRRKGRLVRLTEEQVRYIRSSTESTRVLGRRYGVDGTTVHAARVGETWTHLV